MKWMIVPLALAGSSAVAETALQRASYCAGFTALFSQRIPSAENCSASAEWCKKLDEVSAPVRRQWTELFEVWISKLAVAGNIETAESAQAGIAGTRDGADMAFQALAPQDKFNQKVTESPRLRYLVERAAICTAPDKY